MRLTSAARAMRDALLGPPITLIDKNQKVVARFPGEWGGYAPDGGRFVVGVYTFPERRGENWLSPRRVTIIGAETNVGKRKSQAFFSTPICVVGGDTVKIKYKLVKP